MLRLVGVLVITTSIVFSAGIDHLLASPSAQEQTSNIEAGSLPQPVPTASPDVEKQEVTKQIIARWQFWGGVVGVTLPIVGGLLLTLLQRPSSSAPATPPNHILFGSLSISVLVLAVFTLLLLPGRAAPRQSVPTEERVQQWTGAVVDQRLQSFMTEYDELDQQVQQLRDQLNEYQIAITAINDAVVAAGERIPTESYLLTQMAEVQREFRLTSARISALEVRNEYIIERGVRSQERILMALLATFFGAAVVLQVLLIYRKGLPRLGSRDRP